MLRAIAARVQASHTTPVVTPDRPLKPLPAKKESKKVLKGVVVKKKAKAPEQSNKKDVLDESVKESQDDPPTKRRKLSQG